MVNVADFWKGITLKKSLQDNFENILLDFMEKQS